MATRQLKPFIVVCWNRLLESDAAGAPKLKIDEAKCIIYGVRVVGPFSPNTHGVRGVTEGTEYTREAQESELAMLEGAKVKCNHPPRDNPNVERSVYDTLGVLRDAKIVNEAEGPVTRANLHYDPDHPMAKSVLNDIKLGLGRFGLSHNARWKDADVKGGRLVVRRMEFVESVDLVDKPATNTTLWESKEPPVKKFSLKSILEGRKAKFSAPRIAWSKRLLEMDGMPVDAEAELAAEPETDPDAALKAGFRAAITAVLDDDSMDLAAKKKKIGELMTTEEKLTQTEEPAEPAAEESEEDDEEPGDKKKAEEAIRTENAQLKRQLAVRQLCEAEEFAPTKSDLELLESIEGDGKRKVLIGKLKAATAAGAAGNPGGRPRSGIPGGGGKNVRESKGDNQPAGVGAALSILRRG